MLLFQARTPDSREKQQATALFYGVLERKLTLDFIVEKYARKKVSALDAEVTAALEIGLYQLLYQPSVPSSAAVNESVELIKQSRKRGAAGFVNGILRNFLRDGCKVTLPQGDPLRRASVEFSYARGNPSAVGKDYSRETALSLAEACLGRPPLHARVNTLRCTQEEAAALLESEGVMVAVHPLLPGCLTLEDTGSIGKLKAFREGMVSIQDSASQLCAWAVGAQKGERVFDLCAAPGSKSFTVAQLMENCGELLAFDIHPARVDLIRQGLSGWESAAFMVLKGMLPHIIPNWDRRIACFAMYHAPDWGLSAESRKSDGNRLRNWMRYRHSRGKSSKTGPDM